MDRERASGEPIDETFRALADRRRRIALACLLEAERALTVDELANEVAVRERETREAADGIERMRIELYHKQIPLLANSNLVRYGADRNRVEPTDRVDEIEAFLPTE
ncbi:DUF7344 domain-containing protein [Natronococcus wangiae]|uniref:DUF7344 domain-containing protein n=1 Tax=Natronococcus wangiae TaxID=3068275 RepID=UPI00273D8BB5|nr:hypothetical protein [Natronococcus sp. AD5]